MKRVTFHIVNFVDCLSKPASFEAVDGGQQRINHFHFEWKEFAIHIRSVLSTRETIKTLRDQGGFAVTHIGEIRVSKDKNATVFEIEKLLNAIRLLFSFARGAWAPPILPTGYDENGRKVWERWDSPTGESFAYHLSWLDNICASQQLESVFPGFMRRFSHSGWRDAINEAIYWYLNSNNSARGLDAGLILTQTALERLSYAFTVENASFLSADGFQRLTASDRLRLLFAALDIPQEIPAALREMSRIAKKLRWADAPQALTEMRNEQVHPQDKKRGMFKDALYEAWTVGLWYIEMVLLRLFEYSGPYANRLKRDTSVGEVEEVPWATAHRTMENGEQ